MISFYQVTQKFQGFTTLNGLALFDQSGQFIDTSLPLSDEVCEEVGIVFREMAEVYRAKGRTNNRFTVEIGGKVFLFAEYDQGAFLFMVRDTSEIDAILGAFTHLYCLESIEEQIQTEAKVEVLTPPTKEVVLPINDLSISNQMDLALLENLVSTPEPVRSKRSFFNWALPSAAVAAIILTIGISAADSFASPDNSSVNFVEAGQQMEKPEGAKEEKLSKNDEELRLIAKKKEQMLAEQKKADMRLAEAAEAEEMRLAKVAQAAEEARLAAQAKAAEEARMMAEQKKAAEAAQLAAELKAAEEAKLAAARQAAKKKPVSVKTVSTKKKRYKSKSLQKKKDYCTRG